MSKSLLIACLFIIGCAHTSTNNIDNAQQPRRTSRRGPAQIPHHPDLPSDADVVEACNKVGWSNHVSKAQQQIIENIFAGRPHRLQHALWHAVRGGLSTENLSEVKAAYGPVWVQNHPLCPPPENNPGTRAYNPVGEDFLFMHHEMVMLLRAALAASGQKCISPWTAIPDPKHWPLPDKSTNGPKSSQAYNFLKNWDGWIHDEKWLSQISLSQLGWALEFTIHNNLHMRYATERPPVKFQAANAADDGAQIPMNGVYPADWKFDDPAYNWLADPYGAAVNPTFWKIHGYVDNAIQLWLQANHKTHIEMNCPENDNTCYQWASHLWVGNYPETTTESKSGGLKAAAPNSNDRTFNEKRMQLQRLGVLTDDELGRTGGPIKAAPGDLLNVARAKVCPDN